jgi:hypothetical protein
MYRKLAFVTGELQQTALRKANLGVLLFVPEGTKI